MVKLYFEIETAGDEFDADWLCPANLMLILTSTQHLNKDQIKRVKNLDDGHWSDVHMNIGTPENIGKAIMGEWKPIPGFKPKGDD